MEHTEKNTPSNHQLFHDPTFRLNVKKNYKNELGWEYTVKGETIEELGEKNKEMLSFIRHNVEILREDKKE